MEQRNKTLYVSKTMKQKRAEDLERITSPYGIQKKKQKSQAFFKEGLGKYA